MYILKDKNNNIVSYSKSHAAIEDAKILLSLPDGVIDVTDENILIKNGKMYKEQEWNDYTKTEEYKYIEAKNNAENEIETLKKELLESDYKIIKAMEANLAGNDSPYNMDELLCERNSKRYRINELQKLFFFELNIN